MEDSIEKRDLNLDSEIQQDLATTRRWTMFIAIVGFVFIGLLVILGFSIGSFMSALGGDAALQGVPSFLFGIIYLIVGVIYFFPILYLFRFSSFARKALDHSDQDSIRMAFRNLKAHYQYMGILMIILLAIYVIAGIIFGIAALMV